VLESQEALKAIKRTVKLPAPISFVKRLFGLDSFDVRKHFTKIYNQNLFHGTESRSGTGSSLSQTTVLRRELSRLIDELAISRFLDAPCGDCHWVADLDWSKTRYIGADVVAALIGANQARLAARGMTFIVADLCTEPLPRADLIFCRDCWVHLSYGQIKACLNNFRRSGAEYLLTTTFTSRAKNRELGGIIWRPLNLEVAPFFFPSPIKVILEECTEDNGDFADKGMGLWRLKDLAF
jgi:SAM-dependent methyltransferase